jgi:endonuclease III
MIIKKCAEKTFLMNKNTRLTKKQRFEKLIAYFSLHMPEARTELNYTNPYELIVAVILSAQCTDKRVNVVTPAFFKKYPDAQSLSNAEIGDIYELVKSCSYPNNKSKHLLGMAKMLVNEFKGIVPDSIDALQKLPGVGRKTANVIASVIYNIPAMPVDTHVFRVSARIGLTTDARTPLQTETQLVSYFPEELLNKAHHWLILHGRYVCMARKPLCDQCGIKEICQYYQKKT